MERLLVFVFIIFSTNAFGQSDTIVVTDFTNVFVESGPGGQLQPVTSLEDAYQVGFFLSEFETGMLRVCNEEATSLWVNGKLLKLIEGCDLISQKELLKVSSSDTLFIAISSKSSLADLKCDWVTFEELRIIKEDAPIPRDVRNAFREYVITSVIILLIMTGIITSSYPSRISYLLEKAFTFKISAYEFVNTSFFSAASMNLLICYSMSIAFIGVYLNTLLDYGIIESGDTVFNLLIAWLKSSLIVFFLIIAKWVLISIVAHLFNFKGLRNYQLFDFINFQILLLIPILFFVILDFILNTAEQSWIGNDFIIVFPILVSIFIIWFTLKFVSNSPRKKLMIISYLCATEIIPAVILLGLFFK
ncbi:DUF4271 domain-containing protein [Ekhidna sp.]|uniref:DUF4271 domain-containing protein n=1 Tax=Ekhidna sp. TaxID=2608089 RepID=UPI003BA9D37E